MSTDPAQSHASTVYSESTQEDPSHPQVSQSLLDQLVTSGAVGQSQQSGRLVSFLSEKNPAAALRLWLGKLPESQQELDSARITLSRDVSRIDELLSAQVNAVLQCPQFQALESSWRGLYYLWSAREAYAGEFAFDESTPRVQIRVLDVSKRELFKDFEKAQSFDRNTLFRRVYEAEFGTAGGTPYGMLLANYQFSNHPEDLDLLEKLSEVGAASFAPVIAAASPNLIGVDHFSELQNPIDLDNIFRQERHRKWCRLRDQADTQFLGLTLPGILLRRPWEDDGSHRFGFRFQEDARAKDDSRYLWGNAIWAMGVVVMRAFVTCGWFADIRGVAREDLKESAGPIDGGGLVTGLPVHQFGTDAFGVANRSSVQVSLSEGQEAELCRLGFIPLSDCKDTPFAAFYSNQSVHNPPSFDDPVATSNARISSMLQYVLCCSRIAHYIKVRARNKLGSSMRPDEVQSDLQNWVVDYVTPDEKAPPEIKARYPLRDAQVEVNEILGEPGKYSMTLRLLPHYQLDELSSTMTLKADRVDLKD